MPCRTFSSSGLRPARAARLLCLVGIAAAALLGGLGCSADPSAPTPLNAQELRLVEEVLQLMEIRIERARNPERAAARLDSIGTLYDPAEVDALLDRLAVDPRRAQTFVQAIRASLEQRRLRLFPLEDATVPGS